MDVRPRTSSLSVASDGSDTSIHTSANLVLEQCGQLHLGPAIEPAEDPAAPPPPRPRALSAAGSYIAALCGGGGDTGAGGPQSLTAEVSTTLAPEVTTRTSEASTLPTDVNSNVTRKRSQSLADIQVT